MFDYNTSQTDIILKEHGRNIQNMVKHIVAQPDKAHRTTLATALVEMVKQLNPTYKDNTGELNKKIWDDLYIMSDFQLDVDSPFPPPEKEILGQKPLKVGYNQVHVKYKHYGRNVELLIEKALEITDEKEKEDAIGYIGRLMKSFYTVWNKESVEDDVIVNHMRVISGGKLDLDLEKIKESNLFAGYNKERKKPNNYSVESLRESGEKRERDRNSNNNNNRNRNNNHKRRNGR